MIFFYLLFALVILQRIVELAIAKRNERLLREKGAYEVGEAHYKWIVLLHTLFFIVLYAEVTLFDKRPASWFWLPFVFFIAAQVVRVWAIRSLGVFWNTKIIVLPGAEVVAKGPYRYLRHPNYLIVATEFLTLPLIFQAYFTALTFSLLNTAIILGMRIPDEEKALLSATNYKEKLGKHRRFLPRPPQRS
ncbi:isoprenylcysteine carboxyl methyltransferase family protein [Tuberibacillus calidus]|jgi:methyltransferase|uniref:isoprenylcysteine carboxyl methyltransferase family protein n=1 Tax=Tuberibacillus calidus TaxID=340097 RepID=UPI0003F9A0A2|nr:isoprenylcysteine carboxylmethyltransferase family protein [Tuberibacillus calidus]